MRHSRSFSILIALATLVALAAAPAPATDHSGDITANQTGTPRAILTWSPATSASSPRPAPAP